MDIKLFKDFTKEAFLELNKLQKGEKRLPKTGEDFIDSHIGCILPGDVILISALSGQGKTETLQRMKKKILSLTVNPDAENYVFLDVSLEMKVFNILLRGIAGTIKKKKSDILFKEFTEEEKEEVNKYYKGVNDKRHYLSQSPTTVDQFEEKVREFLTEHKDKEAVFVALDHVLLFKGAEKQSLLEKLCEAVNQLKLEFSNVYFILISQNNRALVGRIAEKSNSASPNAGDVFGSSFLDQLCSFNIILYDAFKMGISQYMKVNPDRYDYLSEYFGDEDSKGKVSFETENKIFVHLIKTRESDTPYKDIFVIEKDVSEESKARVSFKEKTPSGPKFTLPDEKTVFAEPEIKVLSPFEAFGGPEEEDDKPF
ncbi:replicative helicase, DnaB family [Cellulophaga phage phi4:1]|uniref:DnaB family replicative helicase n=5 Tax=Lightbulbvirus TaxID=1918522 RepID=A0A0S2MWW4_9CAUD|nr:DnaB-like replicative helicase [Cellulophaga phage phi4:1]YP_008241693.1 DnaB-like replicative helicase [Cellulophaga phage phi17:2]ALO80206.1 DnaB family replicative helicase [Cellulophaga phage phi4:1_13]ALO80403.1 DnaB family replicative helicase [Cellulophaga phage phi4:1_18]ALO80601.1 DnaB family replicative helicase [Cellulophaga phage phi17:2_18]AGO47731.1 replicative helicase, DnaB family [Cellulophaga phage phi17:2]AGO49610.1 replicative helicase, DnaB family [Cellulophaga phage p